MPPFETSQISFRSRDVGGDVRTRLPWEEVEVLKRRQNLLLLIHGYNNDKAAALQAYHGFRHMQHRLAGLEDYEEFGSERLVEVFWPGDANWGIASFLFYMHSIEHAKETAEALGYAINQAVRESGYKRIDIVAHSVGCRLALELLKHLLNNSEVVVGRLVFMAGAVPLSILLPDKDIHKLRDAYNKKLSEAALSLYSPNDMVLSFAFPLGQSLASIPGGDEGLLPTALGHDRWTGPGVPNNLQQAENLGAGHSDYWGWNRKKEAQGWFANQQVRDFLHLDRIGERTITSRVSLERDGAPQRVVNELDIEGWW